ncbi:winged helix-turn-helix domain-containing protein [Micromonospora sp. WMMD712]|uniref:winged helix-turn-helix domain-containing protein n=1 Tax=Micromonospora sp. WMMD712 TaxID=3016096 RepID=UPI00249A2CDC|nr:winged helix-turn-helix domain-containing protein [Micromonospora sp. WMMD712]WFE56786.1 winged helix-turn-helix domain-containing protein [Micromonospora sp. WMMD712]
MGNDESTGRQAPRQVRLDPRQVRVLAHPLRLRLLGALRVDGPATATGLAEQLGTNTGATSYHLRQLAEAGLVVEAHDLAGGRQRWWRAAHDISSWEPSDFDDDPDARAAAEWIQAEQVRLVVEHSDRWFAVQQDFPPAWRDAAGMSDALLHLGPERLQALEAELWEVLMRYRDQSRPDEADARPVQVFLAAYPMIEPTR